MRILLFFFTFSLFSFSSEIIESSFLDQQSLYYPNETNIFEWEQMYFFLNNKLYSKKYNDFRLKKTLRVINDSKLHRFLRMKEFFNKNFFIYTSPYIKEDGGFVFQNKTINRVYEILSEADSPREIFKCLCIIQNSLLYKYSTLEFTKKDNIDLFFKEFEYENLQLLYFIDLQTRDFGFNGCCSLSSILCENTYK
jgi:hypothetical protein